MVVRDPKIIKIIADPVRREILRQLTIKPQTQSQLAAELRLTPSSVGHHVNILLDAGLVVVQRTKVGTHGILEKYYGPTHRLFIEDFDKMYKDDQKYFLHSHVERLRGMLSVLQILEERRGRQVKISPQQLKDLAQDIVRRMAEVGEKYEEKKTKLDREELLIKVYSQTLKKVMEEDRWRKLFSPISQSGSTADDRSVDL